MQKKKKKKKKASGCRFSQLVDARALKSRPILNEKLPFSQHPQTQSFCTPIFHQEREREMSNKRFFFSSLFFSIRLISIELFFFCFFFFFFSDSVQTSLKLQTNQQKKCSYIKCNNKKLCKFNEIKIFTWLLVAKFITVWSLCLANFLVFSTSQIHKQSFTPWFLIK